MGQGALSSAPDEATLRAGLHRRGLVGALMFWHGDFRRTWTATLLMITFALLFSYIALRRMVRSGSSKQIRSLWQISTDLAQDNMIDYSELDLESDEYESEDEDDSSVTGLSSDTKMSHALRRALRKDHNSVSKRSSLIMITSSDPLSSLSTRPIQIELEGSKVKSLSPLNPLSGASTVTYGTPPNEAPSNPIVKRSLSASSSGSIGRRRRESGRLLVGSSSSRGNSASPSPARSADGSRPQRPPRTRPVDVKNRSQVVQPLQAASPLTRSTTEDGWTDDVGLGEEGKENTSTPSISTERSFALPAESDDVEFRRGRLVTRDVEGADGRYEAGKRPQFPRLSSILKREAQPFRTASLRGTELSTLIQQPDSASNEGSPLWDVRRDNHQSPSLNPGEFSREPLGLALTSSFDSGPSLPKGMFFSSGRLPSRKKKAIKLTEPDWSIYADSHERARERVEAAAVALRSRSASPESRNRLSGKGVDQEVEEEEEEFWFERGTTSTAAAGRDWDWRKRRARALRNNALAALQGSTGPGDSNSRSASLGNGAANLGSSITVTARKPLPVAPLISFSEHELPPRSSLTIDTTLGRDAEEANSPKSNGSSDGSVTSPLGSRILGLGSSKSKVGNQALYASGRPGPSTTSGSGSSRSNRLPDGTIALLAPGGSGTINSVMNTSNSRSKSSNSGAASSLRKGVGRMMRKMSSSEEPADPFGTMLTPSGTMPSVPSSKEGQRRTSNGSTNDNLAINISTRPEAQTASDVVLMSGGMGSGSLSVPSRLSSLAPSGGKVSLANPRVNKTSLPNGIVPFGSELSDVERSASNALESDNEEMATANSMVLDGACKAPKSSADAHEPQVADPGLNLPASSSTKLAPLAEYQALVPAEAALSSSQNHRTNLLQSSHHDDVGERHNVVNGRADEGLGPLLSPTASKGSDNGSGSFQSTESSSDSAPSRRRTFRRSDSEGPMGSVQSNGSNPTYSQRALAMAAALSASPPTEPSRRPRQGSRSSILRSASGAKSDVDRVARSRTSVRVTSSGSAPSSRSSSVRRGSYVREREHEPLPSLQPEPAPIGMVTRARSASLSSNGSVGSLSKIAFGSGIKPLTSAVSATGSIHESIGRGSSLASADSPVRQTNTGTSSIPTIEVDRKNNDGEESGNTGWVGPHSPSAESSSSLQSIGNSPRLRSSFSLETLAVYSKGLSQLASEASSNGDSPNASPLMKQKSVGMMRLNSTGSSTSSRNSFVGNGQSSSPTAAKRLSPPPLSPPPTFPLPPLPDRGTPSLMTDMIGMLNSNPSPLASPSRRRLSPSSNGSPSPQFSNPSHLSNAYSDERGS